MTFQANIGCGQHRTEGWINIDVHRNDVIRPDVLMPDTSVDALVAEFGENWCHRAYFGHVLEHIPWADVENYLVDIRERFMTEDGEICVVGPDVLRAINMVKNRSLPVSDYLPLIEFDRQFMAEGEPDWENARHHWNCSEDRLRRVLETAGWSDVAGHTMKAAALDPWPVVSRIGWQCALTAHVRPF